MKSFAPNTIIFAALIFLVSRPAYSSPDSAQWLNLLHIKPRALIGPNRSLIDDSAFFIVSDDPAKELAATIDAFQEGKLRCKYPARFEVLSRTYDFPSQECPELDEWISLLNAKSLTYAFPGSFINRPASMFGHTLLRVDGATDLLSYAISFAARTSPDENPVAYSLKGLLGGFNGYFSVRPYYEHVKTYSDRESRDIWEYRLNFSDSEIKLLLYHLWELRDVSFQYFYLDENCSYHLLSLLEVVRPEIDLATGFWLYAIPSDTLKRAVSAHGEGGIKRRPSLFARVKQKLDALDDSRFQELQSFLAAPFEVSELSSETLDALIPLSAYKELPSDLKFELLTEMAGREYHSHDLPVMLSDDPLESHGSLRFSAGWLHRASRDFALFEIRPAYHDVTDPVEGFIPGAEISFFDTKFNWSERDGVKLEDFTMIRILSLLPIDSLFSPFSWRASFEAKRSQFVERPAPTLDVSLGYSVDLEDGILIYSFFRQDLVLSPGFRDNYNYLAGLELGSSLYFGDQVSGRIFASAQQAMFRDSYLYFQSGIEVGILLEDGLSLKFNARRDVGAYVQATTVSAGLAFYF